MEKIKKSYYAIIPANIRYNPKITANAKLLYGEITALCNEKGYCWAGDTYFTDLYGVSRSTIQRWFKQLEDNGYIKRRVVYEEGTRKIKNRHTYLCDNPMPKNETTPMPKNETVNNTVINNTSNNIYSAFFEECWELYPNKKGKGRVSNTKKKEIHKLGDEFKRCIKRYVADVEKRRSNGFKELKYQNGSTFFNSGYVDYLDENYKEVADGTRKDPTKDNGEHREKSLNELIQEELDRQGRTEL